jgi:hypothetical protein
MSRSKRGEVGMTLSSVPLVPLRQAPLYEARARTATNAKLKRLRFQLALQSAHTLLATKSPFDWVGRVLVVCGILGSLAARARILDPALYNSAVGICLVALFLWLLLSFVGQKLGLIDPAVGKNKADAGDFVYSHQKPETSIEDSVAPAKGPAETHEPLLHVALDTQAKPSEWQVVEIKNLGKIRYHFSDSDGHTYNPSHNETR